MDSGYYAACAGLSAQTQALDLIANNVANLNTTGFRGQQQTFQSLVASASGEFANPLNRAINNFNVLGDTRTDLSSGSLQATGNATDLGIEGEGFFVVQTQAGTVYSRNGNFQISAAGQLLTQAGDPVLGEQGPITIPSGPLSISADGTLSVNGAVVDTLRLVELAPGSSPAAVGTSYYSASDTRAPGRSFVRPPGHARSLKRKSGDGRSGPSRDTAPRRNAGTRHVGVLLQLQQGRNQRSSPRVGDTNVTSLV